MIKGKINWCIQIIWVIHSKTRFMKYEVRCIKWTHLKQTNRKTTFSILLTHTSPGQGRGGEAGRARPSAHPAQKGPPWGAPASRGWCRWPRGACWCRTGSCPRSLGSRPRAGEQPRCLSAKEVRWAWSTTSGWTLPTLSARGQSKTNRDSGGQETDTQGPPRTEGSRSVIHSHASSTLVLCLAQS